MAESSAIKTVGRVNDISGQVFGRLTAIKPAGIMPDRRIAWECLCSCGVTKIINSHSLMRGGSKSCGCLHRELCAERAKARRSGRLPGHVPSFRSEYSAIMNAITRCTNPKHKSYLRYGGRGIFVCDRWMNGNGDLSGLECFMLDMEPKPDPSLSLDRIDNSGPYSPENCRWADWKTQANNRG